MRKPPRAVVLFLLCVAGGALATSVVGCGRDEAEAPAETTFVASPTDGKGTATVSPDTPVRVSEARTWRIEYTAGPEGIAVGGGVVLQISPFWGWSPPQIQSPARRGFVTARAAAADDSAADDSAADDSAADDSAADEDGAGASPRSSTAPDAEAPGPAASLSLLAHPVECWVQAVVQESPLLPGERIIFVYGDTGDGAQPGAAALADRFAERDEEFWVKVDGDGDGFYVPIAASPTIDIVAGPAARLLCFAPSMAVVGEVVTVHVAAVDARMNRATDFSGTVKLKGLEPGLAHPADVTFTAADRGAVAIDCVAAVPGYSRILASRDDDDLAFSVSNPTLVLEAEPEYRLFWADLQIHTGLSDGTGMPEDVYAYARDVAGLDIAALTDHDAHGIFAIDERPDVWQRLQAAAGAVQRDGRFVSFLGFEWTSWTYGHKHVLYLDGNGPLLSNRHDDSSDPDRLWSRLPTGRAMTISHHTIGGPVPTDWSFHDDAFEPLVEICSIHGNSEGIGEPVCVTRARPGHGVRDALGRGYQLGFVGSGDTHNGHPGMGDRDAPLGGVAAIYAKELTREAVWEALRARRVYASSGPRVILDFTLNGTWMGSRVALADADAERRVHIEAYAPMRVETLEVFKNDRMIVREPIDDLRFSIDLSDPEPAADGDFYYARLRLMHGQMAWSSPIWIDLDDRPAPARKP